MISFLDVSFEVPYFNQSFYHEFWASEPVGLMPMISVKIAPHEWVSLRGVRLDWRRPFEIWQVVNEEQQPLISDIQRSKLWGLPILLWLVSR